MYASRMRWWGGGEGGVQASRRALLRVTCRKKRGWGVPIVRKNACVINGRYRENTPVTSSYNIPILFCSCDRKAVVSVVDLVFSVEQSSNFLIH